MARKGMVVYKTLPEICDRVGLLLSTISGKCEPHTSIALLELPNLSSNEEKVFRLVSQVIKTEGSKASTILLGMLDVRNSPSLHAFSELLTRHSASFISPSVGKRSCKLLATQIGRAVFLDAISSEMPLSTFGEVFLALGSLEATDLTHFTETGEDIAEWGVIPILIRGLLASKVDFAVVLDYERNVFFMSTSPQIGNLISNLTSLLVNAGLKAKQT